MTGHAACHTMTGQLPCKPYQWQPTDNCRLQHVLQAASEGPRKPTVVAHFMPADVSDVKQESDILKDCKLHFINYGSHSKQDVEALVRKLGGTVSNCCSDLFTD